MKNVRPFVEKKLIILSLVVLMEEFNNIYRIIYI